ncbi:hypothetical protein GQX73_g7134 [Xylaria multiplex]|uniref:Uncharacterized protein n=1 Tax=Xylaria multiplex TaxID=323545 RepID=A0A7C8MVC5_9PEZI|nr:hypothetical protein GQX73_g7134 [Xylaria multiplex]
MDVDTGEENFGANGLPTASSSGWSASIVHEYPQDALGKFDGERGAHATIGALRDSGTCLNTIDDILTRSFDGSFTAIPRSITPPKCPELSYIVVTSIVVYGRAERVPIANLQQSYKTTGTRSDRCYASNCDFRFIKPIMCRFNVTSDRLFTDGYLASSVETTRAAFLKEKFGRRSPLPFVGPHSGGNAMRI